MEKKPCKKFGVVFIRSRKVMKLQSSESRVRDATPANVQNISHGFLYIFLLILWKKNQFHGRFDHFS